MLLPRSSVMYESYLFCSTAHPSKLNKSRTCSCRCEWAGPAKNGPSPLRLWVKIGRVYSVHSIRVTSQNVLGQ